MSEAKVIPLPTPDEGGDPPRHALAAIGALTSAAEAIADRSPELEQSLAKLVAFARRRITGDYEVDEFGFDRDLTESLLYPALRPLGKYFRIETRGIENLPTDGSALLVANHSGTIPVDGLMLSLVVHDQTPNHRFLRLLGADLVFSTPLLGQFSRKAGHTLATGPDADRLLDAGELVGVFPEGFKGVGKGWAERYRLQRFGRGGFVSTAITSRAPIIPVSIIGAEEIYPMIGDLKPLARALGFPYFPITPFFPLLGALGVVPLPSKWIIKFGEPIPTDHLDKDAADDPMTVFELADQVREQIQQSLYELLLQRRGVFSR
ncbi:hypothetical protein EK0264_05560 [Epidermidibacterium keratini]|uniref:Phospholipid/glycerol acyltransferase domain-containing protein n=1 Tax=Epidermidibacterium keratini TaxID=1891644 RepID=A0A7L4YL53_9ACTN|nr:lysophospholipid acyltransferase family protein [Epidermidibacterium keratini]QHB99797.1 hypothetical protein EK0264_05560 [Epidermidibacterium keratini]